MSSTSWHRRLLSQPKRSFIKRSVRPNGRNKRVARSLSLENLETRSLLAAAPWKLPDFASLAPESYSAESILVSFKNKAAVNSAHDGMKIGAKLSHDSRFREVQLAGLSVEAALTALARNPNVNYAEPNWVLTKQVVSNDPYYTAGSLWGMYGDGTSPTNQFGSQAGEAWAKGQTGSGSVYVGIIDEGIDYTHPDLAANIWTNPFDPKDGVDNDSNGYIDDVHGWDFANNDSSIYDGSSADLTIDEHGTHVAGTIGAHGGNEVGVAGANWAVKMISGKFLTPTGGTIANAIKAVHYFTDLKIKHGLNIVATSNSWGGGGFSQGMQDAITRAAQHGILFIAAAGNGGSDQVGDNNDLTANYPSNYDTTGGAGYDSVIAVAAIDSNGGLASFSNYGVTTVDLGAPGVSVYSTTPGGGYLAYSGTSMATPHVTGAAALYAAMHPGASAAEIKHAILDGAVSTITTSLVGKTYTGGRLNVPAALKLDADTVGARVVASTPAGTYFGSVSSATVSFQEAIQAGTFTADDIASFTLTGSDGTVTELKSQIAGVSGSGSEWSISFENAFSSYGTYRMAFGPEILDLAGNRMNQDRDGSNGELTEDQYTLTFTIGNEFRSDPKTPIYDWSTNPSTITINQDITIADLDVKVNISHPYDGDLLIHLHDPSGNRVILSNRRGGSGDNYGTLDASGKPAEYTRFDDEASITTASGIAPFLGSYRPDDTYTLSRYDNTSAKGTWTLYVEDWRSGYTGTVNSWSLVVTPTNAAPSSSNDTYTFTEDVPLSVAAPGVLANDIDADGQKLTAQLVSGPRYGRLSFNSDGSFAYAPDPDFSGADSFTYRASDGLTAGNLATVTLTGNPVNDAPVAKSDAYRMEQDKTLAVSAPGVLANDTDADGNALTAVLVSSTDPNQGTLTLKPDGSFSYTPVKDFVGTDSFTYKVNDGSTDSGVVTVTIEVTKVNQAPVAVDDSYATNEDLRLTVSSSLGVLANDTDAEGSVLTAVLETGPSYGTLVLNSDGSFTYTPNLNFFGTDSFTYRASDGVATSNNIASVTLTVSSVNDAPVVANDSYSVDQDKVLSVQAPGVLASDTDVEGGTLTAVLVSANDPNKGALTFNSDGSFTYTPKAGFAGTDSFTYRAKDTDGAESNIATVSITVNSAQPVVKAQDGFESGGSGGTGWSGPWMASGDAYIVSSGTPQEGAYHARLRRGNGWIQRGADLSGWSDVHLSFWSKVNSFESSDQAFVRVSGDGGQTWSSSVLTFTRSSSTSYSRYDVLLPNDAQLLTKDFRVAFDAQMNSTGDYWYIDSVQLIGKAPAATSLATMSAEISIALADVKTAREFDPTTPRRGFNNAVAARQGSNAAAASIEARQADAYFAAVEQSFRYRSSVLDKAGTAADDLLDSVAAALLIPRRGDAN